MFYLLVAGAALAFVWPWVRAHAPALLEHADPREWDGRHIGGGLLLAAAMVWWLGSGTPAPAPEPPPAPAPTSGLDLRGLFRGPTAAADAAAVAAMTAELASIVEWDATEEKPAITTGIAFDDLRVRLRTFLLKGDSIGKRQPAVVDAIAAYFDRTAGTSGGPLTPEQKARWVDACREVSRQAEAAIR